MIERRDPAITDLERRVSNALIIGRVSQVDHEKHRYRVKAGKLETDWIPMAAKRAGGTKTYDSLTVDEQVIVASPAGDMAQGVILGSIATEATQAADKGNIHRTVYDDGTVIEHDHDAKSYSIAIADGGSFAINIGGGVSIVGSGGSLTIKAPGGFDIESPTLTHNGKDISEKHKHKGVVPGGSLTGVVA